MCSKYTKYLQLDYLNTLSLTLIIQSRNYCFFLIKSNPKKVIKPFIIRISNPISYPPKRSLEYRFNI